jgi:cell division protein ZapA (FtsZ GTPase activity inhibitor)
MIKKTRREDYWIVELFCDRNSRVERAKKRGENLWKEKYLCGSVDANKDKKDNYYLKFVKSIAEEKTLIKKLTKINNDKSILDYITENDSPIKLVGDDDDKSLFKQYHNYNEIAEQQLNFDTFMGGKDFKIYYLSEDVEEMAEEQVFSHEDCDLQNFIDLKKRKIKELECRIDDSLKTDEFLVLAGLMQTDELNQNNEDSPRLSEQLLEKTIEIGKLQENIRIYFYDKKLYVNGIATNIDEFSLFCLYNGLVAFISHEKALTKVAKLLIKRLRPLFGIEYEVSK